MFSAVSQPSEWPENTRKPFVRQLDSTYGISSDFRKDTKSSPPPVPGTSMPSQKNIDLRVEDHETPIAELRRVFQIHQATDLLRAHVRYTAYYDALGNEAAAERERMRIGETLRKTLARDDATAGMLNALAWYCATADVYLEESLEAAKRAVALEPENTGIMDTLAEVRYRMGRTKEAIETIDRAIAIDPEDNYLREQRKKFAGTD